jgi:hypothetical protein
MKIGIYDSKNAINEIEVDLNLFRSASEEGFKHGLAKLNSMVPTGDNQATAAQQVYARLGVGSTNLANVMSGQFVAGAVTEDGSITGRLAIQAYLMDAMENKLRDSDYGIIGLFNRKAAMVDTINNTKFDRPLFNYARPEAGKARNIAQLSEPASMLTITVSDVSYKITGTSIGMEISDEASRAINVDLVALAMGRQAEEAAVDYAEDSFLRFLQGDADVGQAALSATTAQSYDAAITTAGTLTQKAWMKWLFSGSRSRRIDTIITDFDGALAIQNRAGRPVITGDNGTSKRIDTLESIVNPTWADNVEVIVSQDPNWPANTLLAFDSRYGYHVVNSSVLAYNAMEQFAIRRSTKVRVDTGVLAYRMYDQAWQVLSLTV